MTLNLSPFSKFGFLCNAFSTEGSKNYNIQWNAFENQRILIYVQRRRNRFEMSGAIFNQHLRVLKSSGAIAFELCNFLKIEWCNCTTCTPLTPPLYYITIYVSLFLFFNIRYHAWVVPLYRKKNVLIEIQCSLYFKMTMCKGNN